MTMTMTSERSGATGFPGERSHHGVYGVALILDNQIDSERRAVPHLSQASVFSHVRGIESSER